MPTYEYACSNGHQFEVEQRITEDPLKTCTQCKAKVQRLLSAPRFILKGGGWYSDGYASKSGGGSDSKGGGGDSGSSASSSSSSSSKDGDCGTCQAPVGSCQSDPGSTVH
jgi:putative FmdB family regulatory protein